MADIETLIIDGSVAVGTLALAFLTVYQLRLFQKERQANFARELVEKVYLPIRKEVETWSEDDRQSFGTWPQLKENYPHLTPFIPKELSTLLEQAGPLSLRLGTLRLEVSDLISQASKTTADKMNLHSPAVNGQGSATFGVSRASQPIFTLFQVYLKEVWLSGETLTEHVSKRVQNRWPGMQWVVELYLDGGRVGENAEAESFAKEALELLEGPKSALEYRAKVLSLRHLSSKAMPLLDAKIRESMGIKSETKKNKRRLRLPRLRH